MFQNFCIETLLRNPYNAIQVRKNMVYCHCKFYYVFLGHETSVISGPNNFCFPTIGVAKGRPGGHNPDIVSIYTVVILCFERRYPKQNCVIQLKFNILAPPIFLPLPKILDRLRHCSQRPVVITFATKFYLRSETYISYNFMHCSTKRGIF